MTLPRAVAAVVAVAVLVFVALVVLDAARTECEDFTAIKIRMCEGDVLPFIGPKSGRLPDG